MELTLTIQLNFQKSIETLNNMAVQTILDLYERKEIDLLYSEAVDLLALLDDQEFEQFCDQNPRFIQITSGDFRNINDLREIIHMLSNYN